jgi:hypothetical protein
MTFAAGALSQLSVGSNTDSLASAVATGGTGPYTYQWYRSTTTGFSPGGGNIITGATALTLSDSGLIPNTVYYYKVVATDTGNSNVTATSTQLVVTTTAPSINPNSFAQTTLLGQVDQKFNYNTKSVQIGSTQTGVLYPGQAVKWVATNSGGVPQVVACTVNTDQVMGYIEFDIRNQNFAANQMCNISQGGNVIYLYATTAISAGAQVCSDAANNGVQATGNSACVVGWAMDQATAYGALIRINLSTPAYATA